MTDLACCGAGNSGRREYYRRARASGLQKLLLLLLPLPHPQQLLSSQRLLDYRAICDGADDVAGYDDYDDDIRSNRTFRVSVETDKTPRCSQSHGCLARPSRA